MTHIIDNHPPKGKGFLFSSLQKLKLTDVSMQNKKSGRNEISWQSNIKSKGIKVHDSPISPPPVLSLIQEKSSFSFSYVGGKNTTWC